MVELSSRALDESVFQSVLRQVDFECQSAAKEIPALAHCKPYSPNAYNAVSMPVLQALCACIAEINNALPRVPHYLNLALILYSDLVVHSTHHYFIQYERLQGFQNPKPLGGVKRVRPKAPLRSRVVRKCSSLLQDQLNKIALKQKARIGTLGPTTFPWVELKKILRKNSCALVMAKSRNSLQLPQLAEQLAALGAWQKKIHLLFCDIMGTQAVKPFDAVAFASRWVQKGRGAMQAEHDHYDVLISGSLTAEHRVYALTAQARGIPIILLHHGAQYLPYDEPFYGLYEGAIPDVKIIYGDVAKQAELGTLGNRTNFLGNPISFVARTDASMGPGLSAKSALIPPAQSLRGKNILYFASEFESARYGPHRDVHPGTYSVWQEQLLDWVKLAGGNPMVRLHPKRPSTRYDPREAQELTGPMEQAMAWADVFVIDYPTTSLAYVAATQKPVLFFDLGLRRLHPVALSRLKARCHYAVADVLEPAGGFADMERDLMRACSDSYTELFCRAGETRAEVQVVAEVIETVLSPNPSP